jgi:hypothetical protein
MVLQVKKSDVWRATQTAASGNTGFLGLSPQGDAYHVVAPVDPQIARSVKAGLKAQDGTPFGGYSGWRYFECFPWEPMDQPERSAHVERNARLFAAWAADFGVTVDWV